MTAVTTTPTTMTRTRWESARKASRRWRGARPREAEEEEEEEEEAEEEEPQVQGWSKLTESPSFPGGRQLRPYQVDGLNWLRLNWYLKRNVILGDEMGLGKTAQTLSLLHTLQQMEGVEGPFLIVAPLSTLPHWERELSLWTNFYVVCFHGSLESRKALLNHDWKLPEPRELPSGRKYRYKFQVVLTTYEMVVAHPEPLRQVKWQYMVVDEGHRLKNRHSKALGRDAGHPRAAQARAHRHAAAEPRDRAVVHPQLSGAEQV